ncbi:MAG TPA: hypothetical protein VJV78_47770 [Polyangiales bacterium]|nr:hypothetical protein [Polyangiales bacterium]
MRDLFAAISKDTRAATLSEYTQYLRDRNGEMNLQERTLSKREETIKKYETPPKAIERMNEAEFRAQYRAFDRRNPPNPEMLLLLALVKVNAAEAYGVSVNFERTKSRAIKENSDAELMILCEEGYHTRILLSSANRYGIEVTEPYSPPSALRIMIGGIATAPMAIARPLTLAGEIIATLMFQKLLELAPRVLKHAPATRDAIEERLVEICADEHGHISFNRIHSSPAVLAETRLILPATARIMGATVFQEIAALGAFPSNVMADLPQLTDPRRIPEAVRRQVFLA